MNKPRTREECYDELTDMLEDWVGTECWSPEQVEKAIESIAELISEYARLKTAEELLDIARLVSAADAGSVDLYRIRQRAEELRGDVDDCPGHSG